MLADAAPLHVKLIDFGTVRGTASYRVPTGAVPRHPTAMGQALGTPGYLPLEAGLVAPNPRFDVFGLGATLYHLLTGKLPEEPLQPLREAHPGCDAPDDLELVLAGAGKTRLALELCRSMRAEGWHTGFLGSRDRPPLVGALRRPTLVILDYAEALPRLRELLAALARAGTSDGPSLRVVLLARALGEWWTTLGEERLLAGPLAHAVTLEIGVAPLDPAARTRFQQGATSAFAALLGKPLPASIAPAPEDRGPLWLLAAALVRVLGSDAAEPFAAILAHEERLWCEAMRHRLDSDRLERRFRRHARRIVAALVLRGGAADEEELSSCSAVSQLRGPQCFQSRPHPRIQNHYFLLRPTILLFKLPHEFSVNIGNHTDRPLLDKGRGMGNDLRPKVWNPKLEAIHST